MERFSGEIASASLVCFDGNIPGETMKHTLELCWANSIPGGYYNRLATVISNFNLCLFFISSI